MRKYKYVHIVQGHYEYSQAWQDLNFCATYTQAEADLNFYKEYEPEYPHKIVQRRIPINQYANMEG